ncbi:unnamed protein product [Linum trigynum]|uniref:Reverse transcriptase domain-containing protein n=1 Tax=Linum trigynum TaxID=586398 RepID=A0AAV2E802_9ROSI
MIQDSIVKVDCFTFPSDFVILDMPGDIDAPLILGRPFLGTSKSVINVHNGKLTQRLGDEEITFSNQASAHTKEGCDELHFSEDLPYLYGVLASLCHESNDPLEQCLVLGTEFALEMNLNEQLNALENEGDQMADKETKPLPEIPQVARSFEEPPSLELKPLPEHLEYAFLGEDSKLLVIINVRLKDEQKTTFIQLLRKHEKAIAWKIMGIQGIIPSLCTYKINVEDTSKPVVHPQLRLNLNMVEVVKVEIIKLLDS